MANDENYKIIEKQLAILMTNSVAFASKLYDMFVSTVPMDIEFNIWTGVDTFETITIPNRAKGNIPANFGTGTPEGNVDASYGAIYIDQEDNSVYIKVTIDGTDGWKKIITDSDLLAHDRSKLAHDGILAKIDGAYANGVPHTFIVADAIEGVPHETSELNEDYYAVNKGSLFKLLGGLENLNTEDKTNIVSAINEVLDANQYDSGCAISGNVNIFTNESALMSIITDELGESTLVLSAPFVVNSPSGRKYTFNENIEVNLINAGVKAGNTYSIFLDVSLDDFGNRGRIIVLPGKYYKQARKPYVFSLNDCWLDTGCVPYKLLQVELDDFGNLTEVEKDYVYLGTLTQDTGV